MYLRRWEIVYATCTRRDGRGRGGEGIECYLLDSHAQAKGLVCQMIESHCMCIWLSLIGLISKPILSYTISTIVVVSGGSVEYQ